MGDAISGHEPNQGNKSSDTANKLSKGRRKTHWRAIEFDSEL
jgi:hypothetical protein